jgi:hypothetical protein
VALLAGLTAVAACSQEPAKAPDDGAYLATQTPEPRPDPALDRADPGPAPVAQGQLTPASGATNPTNPTGPTGATNPTNATAAPAPAPGAARPANDAAAPPPTTSAATAPDNTKRNERDRDNATLTPGDQGNGESDLKITQKIRQAVMADGSLSFTAKNVKIITVGGKVTLRGPVKSDAERAAIEAAAKSVAGAGQVDNQIEVKK